MTKGKGHFMMENILETVHLSKKYRKQYANQDISIAVKRNTVYGLLGPNGAGKSTLLKALTGMIVPSCCMVCQRAGSMMCWRWRRSQIPEKRRQGISRWE